MKTPLINIIVYQTHSIFHFLPPSLTTCSIMEEPAAPIIYPLSCDTTLPSISFLPHSSLGPQLGAMHAPCILCAHSLHSLCTLRARSVHATCTLRACYVHAACTLCAAPCTLYTHSTLHNLWLPSSLLVSPPFHLSTTWPPAYSHCCPGLHIIHVLPEVFCPQILYKGFLFV